jgi:protein disulfide-isomerase A6
MFEKIRKQPILQIVLLALVIVIIIAVFTPRGGRLTAGLNVNAHVGSLKGGFNFETFGNKGTLALFHADWCGHCKRLMPEFENFEQSYNGPMSIMKVNEAQDKELVQKHGVQGFPTIRYYPNGMDDAQNFQDYGGPRTASGLNSFMQSVQGTPAQMPDNAQMLNASN